MQPMAISPAKSTRPGGIPRALWRLLITGVLGMGVYYLFQHLPLDFYTARITQLLLNALGLTAQGTEQVLMHPDGFAYEIDTACTGLIPAIILAVGVLSLELPARRTLLALVGGIAGVLVLNELRLVSLFYLGVHKPEYFLFAHDYLWRGLLGIFLMIIWSTCVYGLARASTQGITKS